ncbi:MAG: CRISPR-associated endonuclease Cas3'', partial [Planctomycetaceae bacterium]|nr:CRISPR-associated endonuclease Cas3'' [Planctomycetaceae bacterium]
GWDEQPEDDAILIGTQDMLLSRALNRGYGMSRYRWPMHYALLNNDVQWILDETQLMGVGLTTSAQLDGFRKALKTFGPARTLWMSATLDAKALDTVDHSRPDNGWQTENLEDDDFANPYVRRLIDSKKSCQQASVTLDGDSSKKGYEKDLADAVLSAHQSGTLTLVVLNRVSRSQDLFQAIKKLTDKKNSGVDVCLIHSRFRPVDREATQAKALDDTELPKAGRIIIATQAIEAGVDLSATTLFTELAPWSSLVQRFGRCNRRGMCGIDGQPPAQVFWIDIATSDARKAKDLALPYEVQEIDKARGYLASLEDVGPNSLSQVQDEPDRPIVHVIRRKDLLELFDTTPDLSGNDLDISRYIRDGEDRDLQVYWRKWDLKKNQSPPALKGEDGEIDFPAPHRDELCSVSIPQFANYLDQLRKNDKTKHACWVWDPLEGDWEEPRKATLRPGLVVLLHTSASGYNSETGWTGNLKDGAVAPHPPELPVELEKMDSDHTGRSPVGLPDHLKDVGEAADKLTNALKLQDELAECVVRSAWWHDVGKAHPAFQQALNAQELGEGYWAKSGRKGRLIYRMPGESTTKRKGFRHELASALAWLKSHDGEPHADLVAYLIAAHHGKVRLSIRSMPNEEKPSDARLRFARGLWEQDQIPEFAVGNATNDISPAFTVDLRLMELGDSEDPETGQPTRSWLSRTLTLRETYGPFQLAYLETLVRVADWRGSEVGENS